MTRLSGTTSPKTTAASRGGQTTLPADVASFFTPFISPSTTPQMLTATSVATTSVFSPLASPALAPNAPSIQSRQLQQASMPPPSPSITAEHIMRRQQQMPSLPTMSRPRARHSTSTNASPHHHPYRAPAPPVARIFSASSAKDMDNDFLALSESPQLPSESAAAAAAATAAIIASLNNTPVMQFSTDNSPATQATLSGLHLPDSMSSSLLGASAEQPTSRTLHQLSVSSLQSDDLPETELSNSYRCLSQGSSLMLPASLSQQMSDWFEQTSTGADSAPVMATPAMLMNLPASAHHLPHSSNGEMEILEAAPQDKLSPGMFGISAPTSQSLITQSAPVAEFIHPPAPPPLRIGPSSVTNAQSGATKQNKDPAPKRMARRKSVASAELNLDKQNVGGKAGARRGEASRARRRSRASQLLSPRTTPLVPSILKDTISPSLAPLTPAAIAPRTQTTPQMTPTTPQTRPRKIAATSTTNIVGLEAEVVTRLATKSNYQNIMEGNSEILGLTYRSEFKSGLERRRTNHKNAEQKRRDSLKLCFQDLRARLPHVDPKLVSKIYLLNQANAYIDVLKLQNQRLMEAMRSEGMDPDKVVAQAIADADTQAPLSPSVECSIEDSHMEIG
ncbi:hypothetical protein LPJ55_003936 [Coemansia sp. RSA 990]|nr:hypothetical protein BX667DRAFT_513391 [Coemansia mojavensis]KAJ1749456.1 hypothetical protein LPJ79_003724 [Coemansia sp. RSA 1821]KAJ1871400.1 hypothetical protein LPJ55_003936 [Coemansia sp. RSA 990]KAJ2669589.1 hypothetical protein IWW42_004541 [Coemansia sp. RSA 1085]